MDAPETLDDLEALWKGKEPAGRGSLTPPLLLARKFGDSLRRLDLLLDVQPDVKPSVIANETKRAEDIRKTINGNLHAVAVAIVNYYRNVLNVKIESISEVYGNLPYLCRKISIFIGGETPPW